MVVELLSCLTPPPPPPQTDHFIELTKQYCMASDFFQDWWAEVTHEAKNGSFSEMMGPSISN